MPSCFEVSLLTVSKKLLNRMVFSVIAATLGYFVPVESIIFCIPCSLVFPNHRDLARALELRKAVL